MSGNFSSSFSGGSGGFSVDSSGGGYGDLPSRKRKTKEDIRAERIAYGILKEPQAEQALQEVAQAVIESQTKPGLELAENEQVELAKKLFTAKGLTVDDYSDIYHVLVKSIALEVKLMLERRAEEESAALQILF